jgi:hypothetical protein
LGRVGDVDAVDVHDIAVEQCDDDVVGCGADLLEDKGCVLFVGSFLQIDRIPGAVLAKESGRNGHCQEDAE